MFVEERAHRQSSGYQQLVVFQGSSIEFIRILRTLDIQKSDEKTFPVQIQPGNPKVPKGEHFLIAGNTTKTPNGAVLSSAPVACQKGFSNLTFR